jgi:hypothetical protein
LSGGSLAKNALAVSLAADQRLFGNEVSTPDLGHVINDRQRKRAPACAGALILPVDVAEI